MRETNTLVLSHVDPEKLSDGEYIHSLQLEVMKIVPNTDVIQFIVLKSLRKIVLIFSNRHSAVEMYKVFKSNDYQFDTTFSLKDYTSDVKDNYLKLPSHGTMFLISPPASPPAEFDFSQQEEEPNKLQIYTHEELRESLEKYNRELKEILETRKSGEKSQDNKPEEDWIQLEGKEIVLNDNHNNKNAPRIILHPIKGHNDHLISDALRSFRTSLPAKSIFDDLSDNEGDEE